MEDGELLRLVTGESAKTPADRPGKITPGLAHEADGQRPSRWRQDRSLAFTAPDRLVHLGAVEACPRGPEEEFVTDAKIRALHSLRLA
jgi:hypothetical protein